MANNLPTKVPTPAPMDQVPSYLSHLRGKTLVMIDGSNLYSSTRLLNFDIDYKRLITFFRRAVDLVDAQFFASIDLDAGSKQKVVPFLDALNFAGYKVNRKEVRRAQQSKGRDTIDVEIAVAGMEAAITIPNLRNIIIFSGNGDLESLIHALRRRGLFVMVVSTTETVAHAASLRVQRAASEFVEIQEIITAAQAAMGMTLNASFSRENEFVPVEDLRK